MIFSQKPISKELKYHFKKIAETVLLCHRLWPSKFKLRVKQLEHQSPDFQAWFWTFSLTQFVLLFLKNLAPSPQTPTPPQREEVDLEEQQLRQKLHELTDNISDQSSDEDRSGGPQSSQEIPAWRSSQVDLKPSRIPTRSSSRLSSRSCRWEEELETNSEQVVMSRCSGQHLVKNWPIRVTSRDQSFGSCPPRWPVLQKARTGRRPLRRRLQRRAPEALQRSSRSWRTKWLRLQPKSRTPRVRSDGYWNWSFGSVLTNVTFVFILTSRCLSSRTGSPPWTQPKHRWREEEE